MQPISAEPVHFGSQSVVEQPHETRGGDAGSAIGMLNQPSTPAHVEPRRTSQPSPSYVQGIQLTPDASLKSEGDGSESDTLSSSQKAASEGDSRALSRSMPSSIGYLSNRWNFGNSFSSTPGRICEDAFR